MKKIILLLSILLFICSGCTSQTSQPEVQENSTQNEPAQQTETAQPATEKISEDDAKNIALKDAGVEESAITFINIHTDYENSKEIYDIEFMVNEKEYDYEIDALSGEIISKDFEIDNRESIDSASQGNTNGISSEEALEIALKDCGLTKDQINIKENHTEIEYGIEVHKIEFISGQIEYEYEIRVSDGSILEKDQDNVND